MVAKIISTSNNKGGVGKSSMAFNIGTLLSSRGYKVLIVDLDVQCNLSQACLGNGNFEQLKENAKELFDLDSKYTVPELIFRVPNIENLDIIPGQVEDVFLLEKQIEIIMNDLKQIRKDLKNVSLIESICDKHILVDNLKFKILSKKLSEVKTEYDYIILDLPPSLTRIPRNAWVASDYLLIPIADRFSLNGIQGLLKEMISVKRDENEDLKFLFVFNKVPTTKNRFGTTINKNFKNIMIELYSVFNATPALKSTAMIMKSFIRISSDVEKIYLTQDNLSNKSKYNPLRSDYEELIDELLINLK